jgi:hypothetical protein
MINQRDNFFWFKLNGLLRYALAHTATRFFPLYIVNEHPKSGGSWVGDMLSDALGVPFPRNRLPIFGSSILHGHMMHSWNMNNVLIVWRDGRDVLISQYYDSLFENDRGNARLVRQCRADLDFNDYDDIVKNLPAFMEYVYERRRHPKMSWTEFGNRWADCERCVHVKYESLRVNPVEELSRIATELSGQPIPLNTISAIVGKHSFQRLAGRNPGEQNKKSFLRKGIVGDWKNYFNEASKRKFDGYTGALLIKLGYEPNNDWVSMGPALEIETVGTQDIDIPKAGPLAAHGRK